MFKTAGSLLLLHVVLEAHWVLVTRQLKAPFRVYWVQYEV